LADAVNSPGSKDPATRNIRVGQTLAAAREQKGIAAGEAVAKTRIPKHYLEMIEADNYSMIADQLYLLPFVRRYAAFLGLDPDETALRFVHELQHAEGTPLRPIEPMALSPRRRRESFWRRSRGLLIAAGALAAAALLSFYLEHRPVSRFAPESTTPARVSSSIQAQGTTPAPLANQIEAAPSIVSSGASQSNNSQQPPAARADGQR